MKILFSIISLSLSYIGLSQTSIKISLEQLEIEGMPYLHSFAYAQYEGKYLMIGGRTGIPTTELNYNVFVFDPIEKKTWETSLESLDLTIKCQDHLSSSLPAYIQIGNYLYFVGGQGFVQDKEGFGVFPYLTRIDVKKIIDSVIHNTKPINSFVQVENQIFRTMGGTLLRLDSEFYLIGGRKMEGTFDKQGKLQIEENAGKMVEN